MSEPLAGLGDEKRLAAAFRRHGAEIYRFVRRGLDDAHAAEDVVQEVFLKAWRFADRYDPNLSSLRVWLFGIARNALVDHLRAESARPWQGRVIDPASSQVEETETHDHVDKLLDSYLVEEALRQISPDHRTALVHTHLLERPYAEVAEELGIPVGTLRSRVYYGLKALKSVLDQLEVNP